MRWERPICSRLPDDRVSVASSSAPAARSMASMHGATIDEDTPPDPDTVYGASKVAAEQAMIGYVREHGVDAVALRLAWVYGPGAQHADDAGADPQSHHPGKGVRDRRLTLHMTHYLFIEDVVRG